MRNSPIELTTNWAECQGSSFYELSLMLGLVLGGVVDFELSVHVPGPPHNSCDLLSGEEEDDGEEGEGRRKRRGPEEKDEEKEEEGGEGQGDGGGGAETA